MADFYLETNATDVAAWLQRIQHDQMPFAISLALNNTAKDFQSLQRQWMQRAFEIRRKSFMERSIKIRRDDFSSKRRLEARVRVETPGGGGREDIFTKFEEGGIVTPHGTSTRFAVPDEARRTKTGVLRKTDRPKSFSFEKVGQGPEAEVYVGRRRTFMIRRKDGTGGIYQREGQATARASDLRTRSVRDTNIRTLYRFTPRAQIDARLEFYDNARGVVEARFADNFREAFDRAIGAGVGKRQARRISLADVHSVDRVPRRVRR